MSRDAEEDRRRRIASRESVLRELLPHVDMIKERTCGLERERWVDGDEGRGGGTDLDSAEGVAQSPPDPVPGEDCIPPPERQPSKGLLFASLLHQSLPPLSDQWTLGDEEEEEEEEDS
jgi:hypothetical protein